MALNAGISRNPFMQSCLREICFYAAIGEFQIRAKEIAGSSNRIPDYLSRWQEGQKYTELFHSSVANEFGTLTEYFVTEELFRFSHDW